MPSAGTSCPLCELTLRVAGPLCQDCLNDKLQLTERERWVLASREPEAEYNQLLKRIDWWLSGPPGEASKLDSF